MTDALFSLAGRTALVTGASSGLGRRFAEVLAKAGASVALAARRKDKLDQAAAEIEESIMRSARDASLSSGRPPAGPGGPPGAHAPESNDPAALQAPGLSFGRLVPPGARVVAVPMDVSDIKSIAAGFAAAEAALGTLTVLINNAGIAATGPALETTEAEWDRVMDVNLKGAFFVATEAARRMVRANKEGAIVNVASIAGIRVAGGIAPYAVAKAGLDHLTRTLAQEWARFGIRVNALAPGYIATELNREFLASEAGESVRKRIPMRRFGEASDLDGALLLLASEAGRFMTGATVVVDGGHLASAL
jgi:NAD(P)-dependent dehydrogenase (short-subunit alcohol dehydrogenase family)